ncbi:hypothetical protein VB740_06555 [Nostoc sp. UHCC 0251]|nr:hypothetical protein [Nostoc sp. UHCC 0251]MEA5622620.1 hypothetical protein [Nostoc sp. UHCC 0251]
MLGTTGEKGQRTQAVFDRGYIRVSTASTGTASVDERNGGKQVLNKVRQMGDTVSRLNYYLATHLCPG